MRSILAAALLLGASPATRAQDAVKADPQHNQVVFENDEVRVLRFRIAPGEKTAMHSHPRNIVVHITGAKYVGTTADGKVTPVEVKAGDATWREGTTHAVENAGTEAAQNVIIEFKTKAPRAKAAPATLKK